MNLTFRGDAAFAKPEIYEYLEENGSSIRLPANEILQKEIKHLLARPVTATTKTDSAV